MDNSDVSATFCNSILNYTSQQRLNKHNITEDVTLDHKTSHKGQFFKIWKLNKKSYVAKIQLFENLESEGAKKSKYWENCL